MQARRLIRTVLADESLVNAERIVIAAVILSADNETGLAWASDRSLRREFSISNDVIAGVLRSESDVAPGKAIGRYLAVARRGKNGSICYKVLQIPERSDDRSALQFSASGAPVGKGKPNCGFGGLGIPAIGTGKSERRGSG